MESTQGLIPILHLISGLRDKMLADLTGFISFLRASLKQATEQGRDWSLMQSRAVLAWCVNAQAVKKKKARRPNLAGPMT